MRWFTLPGKEIDVPSHRILVVDDSDAIREVVKLSLELIGGWEVLEASGGQDGFHIAIREQPDAIILDVDMPGWDGPTTLIHLHENAATASIPIIFLTARGHTSELLPLHTKGLVAIIHKPFDPTALVKRVALALQWIGTDDS